MLSHQIALALNTQLAANVLGMRSDRFDRDTQSVRDIQIRLALDEVAEDLILPTRQHRQLVI